MTLNLLLRLHAVLAILYATLLLLLPRLIIDLMSTVQINAVGIAITRLFGAALVLVALLVWGTSNLGDRTARRLVTIALFMYVTLGAVLTLIGQIGGLWNTLGWANVISCVIFVAGYGYFLLVKPE